MQLYCREKAQDRDRENANQLSAQTGGCVILLHGLFGSSDNLQALYKVLAQQYQVFSLDLRNHGRSPHSEIMDLGQMANDVALFIEQQNLDDVVILGHSLGGKVAMQLASTSPGYLKGLVVVDIAPVEYGVHHDAVLAGLNAIDLDSIKSRTEADQQLQAYVQDVGVRQFLLKSLCRNKSRNKSQKNGQFGWRFNLPVLTGQYKQLLKAPQFHGPYEGPCLFIKGELSDYILPEHQRVIESWFPNFQFKMIQGAGHWLHAEKPVAFAGLVRKFLDGI